MEYSEIILIALVLLVVFCGAQLFKLFDLLSTKRQGLDSVKTVIKAPNDVQMPRKVVAPKSKTTQVKKKAVVAKKKAAPVKKSTTAKKSTTKKKK